MEPPEDAPTVARVSSSQSRLHAGERWFGRFVLEALVGRGGMSVVWRARDELLGETIALKFLPEPLAGDPRALADLRAETRRARQLAHPQIVRIHEFYADEAGAAVAMELVDGRSLATEIAACGQLNPDQIMTWLPDLVAALDYAHSVAKVVHRDLKPGNVLLPASGGAKLADFGISCRITETATRCTHLLSGGTLAYMSPQQLAGDEPSPADDIYALGALLYELVTGRPPFTGGDLSHQIRNRAPAPPSQRRDAAAPPLPAAWERTIRACLEKNPSRRPASVGSVMAGLRGELQNERRARRRLLTIGAMALAVVAGGWGAWRVWPVSSARPSSTPSSSSQVSELPPLAAPEFVRGSLGRNLVAHLPLAGDYENHASDRGRAIATGVGWTEDRFSRKDSAYLLSGRNHLELPFGAFFHLGTGTRFTLMAWVRVEEGEGALLSLLPAAGGVGLAQLSCLKGKLTGYLIDRRTYLFVDAGDALWDRKWHHVALSYDGAQVRVHLDGEPVAARAWEHSGDVDHRVNLVIGPKDWGDQHTTLRGAVADVRFYRSVVVGDPLLSIVREDAPAMPLEMSDAQFPWERSTSLAVTRGLYEIHGDWNQAVQREFGAGARVADFSEIAAQLGRWPRLAAELAAIPVGPTMRVTRGGERVFSGDRVYELTRLDGAVQETFLVHAEIGNYTFVLGSWMDPPLQALSAVVPTAGRYTVETITDATASWRRDLAPLTAENKFCLRLPFDVGDAQTTAALVTVEFTQENGAIWNVAVDFAHQPRDRRLKITCANAGVDHHVEFLMNPTPHELIVVGRRGRLYAAVVDATSGTWRGDLATDSGSFAIDTLRALAVTGVAVRGDGAESPLQWVVWR